MQNEKSLSVGPEGPVFIMPVRHESSIRLRQRVMRVVFAILLLALVSAGWTLPLTDATTVTQRVAGHAAFAALGVLMAILAAASLGLMRYEWLDMSDCTELADLCDEHPGLQPFRNRVLEEGRRFTCGEFTAMKAWVEKQKQQAASAREKASANEGCKRLYGLAQD
jgi:hypothetical protein